MRSATLGIRDLVTAIVLLCSLGGLVLSLGIAFAFQDYEDDMQELREASLAMQDLDELRRNLEAWFPIVDEAIALSGKHAEEARLRANEVLLDLKKVGDHTVAQPFHQELESLEVRVAYIQEGLELAAAVPAEGAERNRELEAIRKGVGLLSSSLDRVFERLKAGLMERNFHLTETISSRRGDLWKTTLFGVAAYLLLILGLWRWSVRHIIRPLLRLTAEARHCLSKGASFRLEPAGPLEVRRLTQSVSSLVDDLQTSRDTLEDKVLERTAELERANQAKTEFLAKVTHEIRTPMTGILGYAELCRRPETTDEERLEYLYTISINGEHLVSIISDILDISKIEAGRMTVETAECAPARVVGEVVNLLEISARDKDLDLVLDYRTEVPDSVLTDSTRLRQILLNLVGNAVKFTERGSVRLTVSSERSSRRTEQLSFVIEDTGVGMTQAEIETIFDPFVQADNSYSRQHGGTGLGLSISRALARLLGGDISCATTEAGGCRFELTINAGVARGSRRIRPDLGVQAEPASELEAVVSDLTGRALLAEDVELNRKLVALMLERHGLVVDHAENGLEAYQKAIAAEKAGDPYAIVLMDMQMPEMDGYEATRRLRGEGFTRPIIALTAHSMTEDRDRCLEAGCDDYTTKPVTEEVLLQVVRAHVTPPPGQRQAG